MQNRLLRSRRFGTSGLGLPEIAFGYGANAGLMVRGMAADQERAVGRMLDVGNT